MRNENNYEYRSLPNGNQVKVLKYGVLLREVKEQKVKESNEFKTRLQELNPDMKI